MTFKLMQKNRVGVNTIGDNQLSINTSNIYFGTNFSKFLAQEDYVEIYLDIENSLIGFKPTNNSTTGFKNQLVNGNRLLISNKRITNLVAKGKYDAAIYEHQDMVVVKVKEIAKI